MFARKLEHEMDQASSRSKNEKGKNAARLRILQFYIRTETDGPKRFKDPAAPQLEPKAGPDTEDLGSNFFD